MRGAAASTALLMLVWFATFHIPLVEHANLSMSRRFGEVGSWPRTLLDSAKVSVAGLR